MKDKLAAVLKYHLPAILRHKLLAVLGVFFVFAFPVCAQHGGGGGHAGGFGGGHGMGGHSVGHSLGHIFGSHSGSSGRASGRGNAEEPPMAGAAMIHGRIVQLPGPGARNIHPITAHRPLTTFGFRPRRGFFGFGFGFGFGDFGFCSPFDDFFTGYAFGAGYGCPLADFSFDPFYGSGYSPDFGGMEPSDEGVDQSERDLAASEEFHPDTIVEDEPPPPVDKVPHHRRSPREPDTILQLKDGSMYGLRDYWVEDGRLYYVTNYGGQNAVPLSQIDFAKSERLNADRGEKFGAPDNSGSN